MKSLCTRHYVRATAVYGQFSFSYVFRPFGKVQNEEKNQYSSIGKLCANCGKL